MLPQAGAPQLGAAQAGAHAGAPQLGAQADSQGAAQVGAAHAGAQVLAHGAAQVGAAQVGAQHFAFLCFTRLHLRASAESAAAKHRTPAANITLSRVFIFGSPFSLIMIEQASRVTCTFFSLWLRIVQLTKTSVSS